MPNYIVSVGQYTNKKNVTKDWLFIREPGNGSWGNVLLNPSQCAALVANLDTVRSFAGAGQQPAVQAAPAQMTQPARAPIIISSTESEPLPALVPMPAPKPKAAANQVANLQVDPKNAAGQTDITQHVNPKVAALIAKAMGASKRSK